MYSEKVAKVFNSVVITEVCNEIDKGHSKLVELKEWLLQLINGSVDLSVKSLSNQPYQQAYDFVKQDLYS